MYCSGNGCSDYYPMYKNFDELFYKYKVDIFLGAHKH